MEDNIFKRYQTRRGSEFIRFKKDNGLQRDQPKRIYRRSGHIIHHQDGFTETIGSVNHSYTDFESGESYEYAEHYVYADGTIDGFDAFVCYRCNGRVYPLEAGTRCEVCGEMLCMGHTHRLIVDEEIHSFCATHYDRLCREIEWRDTPDFMRIPLLIMRRLR